MERCPICGCEESLPPLPGTSGCRCVKCCENPVYTLNWGELRITPPLEKVQAIKDALEPEPIPHVVDLGGEG